MRSLVKIYSLAFFVFFTMVFYSCSENKTEREELGKDSGELVNKKEVNLNEIRNSFKFKAYRRDGRAITRNFRIHIQERGMDYVMYPYGEGLILVNLTKDSLEVELLKKQLTK